MNQSFTQPDAQLSKSDKYRALLPQLSALTAGEPNLVANLANLAAALKAGMGFYWVGFYLEDGDELVLGPFQGPVACTRISKGKGVCGTAWQQASTIIVPNVDKFPGHIACSAESRSEIVLPVIHNDIVHMVLDVDSHRLNDFDETDNQFLSEVCTLIIDLHFKPIVN